jgi:asparagine synthase (glutamine-hydrolysing)
VPNADPSAIPLWYVCRETAAAVKVALAGEGGDELFGGYARYAWDARAATVGRLLPAAPLARALERVPGVRRRVAGRGRKDVVRRSVKLLKNAGLPQAERYFSWFALVSDDVRAELVGGAPATSRWFARWFDEAPANLTQLGRLQYVDVRGMLMGDLLLKADRMSMTHSLELRVPFTDSAVAAAGLALPDKMKVRGVETKRAIRELVARRLPREIARRPKQGFETPIGEWLRGELRDVAIDVLSPERLRRGGLVDPRAASALLRRHLQRDEDSGLPLYALIVLELWRERVTAPVATAAGAR